MLANGLIGLREGLEAALVVSILMSYLVRTGRTSRVRWVWLGVVLAVALSLLVGALLEFTSASLSFQASERFGGIMSIIAVGLVTWMIFWMRRAARAMSGELRQRLDAAIRVGPAAVMVMAFIAVAREGLETSVFFWASAQAAQSTFAPVTGFVVGIAIAIALAVGLYVAAVRLDLGRFFFWTGLLLVFVAAGVLSYGFHDLQEAGAIPGLNTVLFDVSGTVPPGSWYATLLKGIFNFSPRTTVVEGVVWSVYVITVLAFYLRPQRSRNDRLVRPREGSTVAHAV